MARNWSRLTFARLTPRGSPRSPGCRRKLQVETLEDRRLMAAQVMTELQYYLPGSTVLISTGNDQSPAAPDFQPGETIRFFMERTAGVAFNAPPAVQAWSVTDGVGGFDAFQDAAGAWTFPDTDPVEGQVGTSWHVPLQFAEMTLLLTATGLTSGAVAQAGFFASTTIASVSVSSQSGTLTYGTGSTASYTVTPIRGSNLPVEGTVSVVSGLPAGVSVAWEAADTWTSDANEEFPSLTLKLTTSATTPAGTYPFTVRAADGDNEATATGTLVVNKADATITVHPYWYVYSGLTYRSPGFATGVFGEDLSQDLFLGLTAHRFAGTYNDRWVFESRSGNYNDVSGLVTNVIVKAPFIVQITPFNVTYDGARHQVTTAVYGVQPEVPLRPGVDYGLSISNYEATDAGTYFMQVRCIDLTGNYQTTNLFTWATPNVIAKAPLTVKADNKTDTYDGTPFTAFTTTISGFVAGQTLATSGVSGGADFSGPATTAVNAGGPYAVTPSLGSLTANNYTFTTFNSGSLTITPRALTAAIVGDPGKTYDGDAGATLAPANYSLGGLVSGESFTVTRTSGAYNSPDVVTATTVTAVLSAGDFTPGPGTLASNYTFPTGATGAGTITPATASVNVVGYTGEYDGAAHGATGTATGVGGVDLSAFLNLGDSFTDVPGGTANWSFSNSNYHPRSGSVAITILPANQPPTITAPVGLTAYEDVELAVNGILSGDPDGDNLTVTLSVGHGTLTLTAPTGLTASGLGTAAVSLSGSIADLNAALASLVYRGDLNFAGADTLNMTVSDGALSSNASVSLTVRSVEGQAADLRARVIGLQSAGVLSRGRANSLLAKLSLQNNDGDVGKVQAFLHELTALVRAGLLTQARADSLARAGDLLLLGVSHG